MTPTEAGSWSSVMTTTTFGREPPATPVSWKSAKPMATAAAAAAAATRSLAVNACPPSGGTFAATVGGADERAMSARPLPHAGERRFMIAPLVEEVPRSHRRCAALALVAAGLVAAAGPAAAAAQDPPPVNVPVFGQFRSVLAQGEHGAELPRSEEHTSELQSRQYLVCRL